jgi:hypothetical protein
LTLSGDIFFSFFMNKLLGSMIAFSMVMPQT